MEEMVLITFNAITWSADERSAQNILDKPVTLSVSWSLIEARNLRMAQDSKNVPVQKANFLVAENTMYRNMPDWPPVGFLV